MAVRLPPMQALRAFEAAAREKNLTRAATTLHVTHGAISHQIKALEEDLGVRLVERSGRGIRLTDEGARFATRVRAAFNELASAVQELSEKSNPRRLRVSVMPSFAARWLLPRVGSFIATLPNYDLEVHASAERVDLQRDDFDFAIRYGIGPWPGVSADFLADDALFAVCSPRIAGGVPKSPAEVARYRLLCAEDEDWKGWFDAVGARVPEPIRGPSFDDSSYLMQAAADGLGIALARPSLIGNDLRNGLLVKLFDVEVASPRRFWLVYAPRMEGTAKLVAFRNWLRDEFATQDEDVSRPRTVRANRGSTSRRLA